MLVASGQRREAAELARASVDAGLRARGLTLRAARLAAPVHATIRGRAMSIVLGDEIVVGRAIDLRDEGLAVGAIAVASAAVSRRHLAIARREGEVWVRDLGTRNGTMLHAQRVQSELAVGVGVTLRLGGEVPVVVRPADDLPGAVAVEIGGVRYVAPLGAARLGVGEWRVERVQGLDAGAGSVEWIELVTGDAPPAFAGGHRLAGRVTLLAGDAFATEPGGDVAVRFGK
jgi:hypothetical protein